MGPGQDPTGLDMMDPAERERAEEFVNKITTKHAAWATALTEDLEEASMPSDELQKLVDTKKSQAKEQMRSELASLPSKMQDRMLTAFFKDFERSAACLIQTNTATANKEQSQQADVLLHELKEEYDAWLKDQMEDLRKGGQLSSAAEARRLLEEQKAAGKARIAEQRDEIARNLLKRAERAFLGHVDESLEAYVQANHYQEAKRLEQRLKSELDAWAEELVSKRLPLPEEQLLKLVRSQHEATNKCIRQERHLGGDNLKSITDAVAAHMGQVAADLQKKNQAMHDKQAFWDNLKNNASTILRVGCHFLSNLPIDGPVKPVVPNPGPVGRRWPALTKLEKDCLNCQKYERGTFCYWHK